jgi:hypothetical protein
MEDFFSIISAFGGLKDLGTYQYCTENPTLLFPGRGLLRRFELLTRSHSYHQIVFVFLFENNGFVICQVFHQDRFLVNLRSQICILDISVFPLFSSLHVVNALVLVLLQRFCYLLNLSPRMMWGESEKSHLYTRYYWLRSLN